MLFRSRSALRSVAHLREPKDKAYVIYDRIEADAPHVWEWNLHSYRRFEVVADGEPFTLKAFGPSGKVSVCVDLYGPPLEFAQSDVFPIAPLPSEGAASWRLPQWHAVLRTRETHGAATFVAVLREECAPRRFTVNADQVNGTATVSKQSSSDQNVSGAIVFHGAQVRLDGDWH